MSGGNIIGIVLGTGSLIGIVWCIARLIATAKKYPPLPIYGDFPHLPVELRLPGERAGGWPSMAGEPLTDGSHSHVGAGNSA